MSTHRGNENSDSRINDTENASQNGSAEDQFASRERLLGTQANLESHTGKGSEQRRQTPYGEDPIAAAAAVVSTKKGKPSAATSTCASSDPGKSASLSGNENIPDSRIFGVPQARSDEVEAPSESLESLSSLANVRGGDPLGSPPRKEIRESQNENSRIFVDENSVEGTDEAFSSAGKENLGYLQVTSTPDEVAQAKAFYKKWTEEEDDKQREFALKRSTVFSIMQYRCRPGTGEVLWTQEQWNELIASLAEAGALDRYACIWQGRDKDPETGQAVPLHFHGVVRLKPGEEKQIRYLAKRASLPASRIKTPGSSFAAGRVVTGRLAADIAFFDFCQYLVHEDEGSVKKGKHTYARSEVDANFDFGEFLDAGRPVKAKGSKGSKERSDVDNLVMKILEDGLTLKEAFALDPLAYNRGESRMLRARAKWVEQLPAPTHRLNFYVWGDGGCGKDALSRSLARQIVPGDWVPDEDEPFFIAGADNVMFEGYDGQPVMIFEEVRAVDLITKFGRSNLFAYLNPFPGRQRFNVKNASILPQNSITIMTGPDPFDVFLDGLSGGYTDRNGRVHKPENQAQADRRFPFILSVRTDDYDISISKGFVDGTDNYREYYEYNGIRHRIGEVLRRVKGVPPEKQLSTRLALEAAQVAPIVEQYHAVVASTGSEDEDADALISEMMSRGIGTAPTEEEKAAAKHEALAERQRIDAEDKAKIAEATKVAAKLKAQGEERVVKIELSTGEVFVDATGATWDTDPWERAGGGVRCRADDPNF